MLAATEHLCNPLPASLLPEFQHRIRQRVTRHQDSIGLPSNSTHAAYPPTCYLPTHPFSKRLRPQTPCPTHHLLQNGTLDALVLDSYVLEFGSASRCDVTVVGPLFEQVWLGFDRRAGRRALDQQGRELRPHGWVACTR